jgi:hypothetical protein
MVALYDGCEKAILNSHLQQSRPKTVPRPGVGWLLGVSVPYVDYKK